MADDPEASRIRRERDRRTAVERLRIDRERHDRQTELARLERPVAPRGGGTGRGSEGPTPLRMVSSPRESSTPEIVASGGGIVRGAAHPGPREIGGSIPLKEVQAFLQDEPLERFDLVAVNTLELLKIAEEARRDPSLLEPVADRAEALMLRVKRELDDPLSAGAFLRDQTVLWYEQSQADPAWAERMPQRWGGLFTESRSSGGRTVPWVNARLSTLRDMATREGKLGRPGSAASSRGTRRARPRPDAPPLSRSTPRWCSRYSTTWRAIRAIRRRRSRSSGCSELAVRRQVATVNDSLAMIFSGPESGPFVVLHPNRYPRCEELLIRPPGPGALGAALAFTLAPGRPLRKGTGRLHAAGEAGSDRGGHAEGDESPRDQTTSTWTRPPCGGTVRIERCVGNDRGRGETGSNEARAAAEGLSGARRVRRAPWRWPSRTPSSASRSSPSSGAGGPRACRCSSPSCRRGRSPRRSRPTTSTWRLSWVNWSRATPTGGRRTSSGSRAAGGSCAKDPTRKGYDTGPNTRSPDRPRGEFSRRSRTADRWAIFPSVWIRARYSSNGYTGSHPPTGARDRRWILSSPPDASVPRPLKYHSGAATTRPDPRAWDSKNFEVSGK